MRERPLVVHVSTVPFTLHHLRGLLRFLVERGFDVSIVSSPGDLLTEIAASEGVEKVALPMTRRITPFADALALWRFARLFARKRPQILHAHSPKASLLALLAARITGVPVRVYQLHGLPLATAKGWARTLLAISERTCCALATDVIAVSHSLQQEVLQARLVEPSKIRVLGSGSVAGVDAKQKYNRQHLPEGSRTETRLALGINPEALVIGYVGRLVRDKGIVDLASAWDVLRHRHPKAELLLVGPFEQRDPVPEAIKERLAADPRVHVEGERWDTPSLYNAMDVFVLPTYREGLPGVLLEAQAMELPIVATEVTGCVDAVQKGSTAVLIPPGDVNALVDALSELLNAPSRRTEIGASGRRRVVSMFDQTRVWEALRAEYVSLLLRCGHTRAVFG